MANVSPSPLQVWKPFLIELQQSTQKRGLSLRVRHSDRTLHLLLEGAGVSSRKEWVSQVETLLKHHPLESSGTSQILIYGRVNGKRYPSWKASIPLAQVRNSQSVNSPNNSPLDLQGSSQDSAQGSPKELTKGSAGESSLESTRENQRFARWMVRPLRPARGGFKEVVESLASGAVPQSTSPSPPRSSLPQFLEITAELGTVGSQQWLARSILGLFAVAIGLYLYIGTWFIPRQARLWAELQPELDRLAATQPRNLKEMETVLQEMEETIAQLGEFSPLAGVFYQRARAQLQILNDRHQQLQNRHEIEQAGQTYLSQAKRLAAEATLLLEAQPPPHSPDDWRSIQRNWLVALYWLNQVPSQTFAMPERNQLLRQYQQTYRQIQPDAENSLQFSGNL